MKYFTFIPLLPTVNFCLQNLYMTCSSYRSLLFEFITASCQHSRGAILILFTSAFQCDISMISYILTSILNTISQPFFVLSFSASYDEIFNASRIMEIFISCNIFGGRVGEIFIMMNFIVVPNT